MHKRVHGASHTRSRQVHNKNYALVHIINGTRQDRHKSHEQHLQHNPIIAYQQNYLYLNAQIESNILIRSNEWLRRISCMGLRNERGEKAECCCEDEDLFR